MATQGQASLDFDALHHLKSTEPPVWLAPRADLAETARTASKQLFSYLRPYTPKSPLDHLLVEGFDAEQIWQQIDLQSQPLLSSLKREVKKFEKNPQEIRKFREVIEGKKKGLGGETKVLKEESDDFDEELNDGFDDDDDDDEDEEEEKEGKKEEEEEEESESEEKENGRGKQGGGIEDEFLKINELQEYLEEDEAREYGLKKDTENNTKKGGKKVLDGEDEDEDEVEEDEFGLFDDDDENEDEDTQKLENARYEDFFGAKNKKAPKKKLKSIDKSEEESASVDEEDLSLGNGEDDVAVENQKNDNLSTHEKRLKKLQSEIEMMEKQNLDPKTWTMQGEVTAAQRPKNSALEVDLDFQHNVRPAPVITEEFTESLEEMIKKRITEGQFDDAQKAPRLPSKAPRELKELDENKSKKGLAEVYEEEYVQKTNPAAAPLSFSDEQKKEASTLFKKLCLKLDALSHFHFTPKPVIEDMSIQANVPALAMEEIAPIAISDAAMLAPEEVFTGKVDVKEETELTQAERKRRRANKKRRFKAEAAKRMAAKKARDNTLLNPGDGKKE